MSDVRSFPPVQRTHRAPPKRIKRPCDLMLAQAAYVMEAQLGTVEFYNRLCDLAQLCKAKIDAGKSTPPLPMLAQEFDWGPIEDLLKNGDAHLINH